MSSRQAAPGRAPRDLPAANTQARTEGPLFNKLSLDGTLSYEFSEAVYF